MEVSFEHHGAWLLLAIPLAAAAVWWLYYHRSRQEDWSKTLKAGLAAIRFIVLIFLAFLLLEPLIVRSIEEEELPKLIVFQDQSASIDSTAQQSVNAFVEQLENSLGDKYDVTPLAFASDVQASENADYDPLYTDYGNLVRSVNDRYSSANIGAMVIATDGIQTKGLDPNGIAFQSNAPLFALGLGDTSLYKDAEVRQVLSNKMAFLGNELELKARIRAQRLKDVPLLVQVFESGRLLEERSIQPTSNNYSQELSFVTTAKRVGKIEYQVSISEVSGERNALNNVRSAYVDVLDNRTRISILAKSPHPDIAAIKQAIEQSDQYQVSVDLISDWEGNPQSADLFILHGLPSSADDYNRLKDIPKAGKQSLIVYSSSTSIIHLNALDLGLSINRSVGKSDKISGSIQDEFNLFNVEELNTFSRFPPIDAPFGEYEFNANHQVALQQSIGGIKTEKPLLTFTEKDGLKTGYFMADGWWRWRLYEAAVETEQGWIDRLMLKTVQYLAIREKRSRLNISLPGELKEREEVEIRAEYYNESFELNNDPEVVFKIENQSGETFSYQLKPRGKGYRLSIGTLPPGVYTWIGQATMNNQTFEQSGGLTIVENKIEYSNLVADHRFLSDWTEKNGGSLFILNESDALIEELKLLSSAKPVIHSTQDWSSVIDWKWLAILLVILLSIEWFIRKYTGYV